MSTSANAWRSDNHHDPVWFGQEDPDDPYDGYGEDGFYSPGETEHFEAPFPEAFERALGPDLPMSVQHGGLRFHYHGDGDPATYRPKIEAAWIQAERETGLR